MFPGPHQNKGQGGRRETGLSPSGKYSTARSKAVLISWIFYVFFWLVCVCLCVSWERVDLLTLVCGV